MRQYMRLIWWLLPVAAAAAVPLDVSRVRAGPVRVESAADSVTAHWRDGGNRAWRAQFSLDPSKPLITGIEVEGKPVIERARPIYRCETGKRRGGWDAFFDFPPTHPAGTRTFLGEFKLQAASAQTIGERLELLFSGLHMGIFEGGIAYTIYPGSRLIRQEAAVKTNEPDTAYFYDTGLRISSDSARRPGGNMDGRVTYYDTDGHLRTIESGGPERRSLAMRHRALATRTSQGTVAVFPPPHQYFFARDFTTNLGFLWHNAWRGDISIGVRQYPDDNSPYYPWMNAPPGSEQRMGVFYLLSEQEPQAALADVLRYTHSDRFPELGGHHRLATHWHLAYTVQAMARGLDWVPPFKPVMKAMGVDAAMIMDFHGDGHPQEATDLRLQELDAYFGACRAQSDQEFLLIPSEEANVHLGGHWALVFPKPVYWFMKRSPDAPFRTSHPKYGTVYRAGNARELLDMVRQEDGYMYQTHPRTKGSTGFPDQIRETEHFRDPRYLGAGWKAMPSDLSSPRAGERSLKLLDDMNNWGLRKRLLGEVDVFQIDATHELYAHMNINYVRAPLASGALLGALSRGDYFVSTGEILLPRVTLSSGSGGAISVRADVRWTFPLRLAEIVWGDGSGTFRKIIPLDTTREFGSQSFEWNADGNNWKWARVAVWDVAGNGAFINPVWRATESTALRLSAGSRP